MCWVVGCYVLGDGLLCVEWYVAMCWVVGCYALGSGLLCFGWYVAMCWVVGCYLYKVVGYDRIMSN